MAPSSSYCLSIFSSDTISYQLGLDRYTPCVCCWNVFLKTGESVFARQRVVLSHFRSRRKNDVPDIKSIQIWVEKFRATDSALKWKPPKRPRSVRTTGWWKSLEIICKSIWRREATIWMSFKKESKCLETIVHCLNNWEIFLIADTFFFVSL